MLAIFLFLLGLLFAKPVFAGEPPIQTSPMNGSIGSSTALNWQTPSYPICLDKDAYRVQVDDDSAFPISSIYRNVYTKNTYYTPQLTLGTWYWRVMVRDVTCNNWSGWSSIWSFTLQSTQSPTPILSPTPTPSPSSPSSSSPTSSPSTSLFTISNLPSEINSDQSFSTLTNLSLPNNPHTNLYLKGAFKKADSSNYFGLTKVSGSWIKNGSTYSNQYLINTDSAGNWSGNLEIQPDNEDSGFTGTGDYIFKVGRYTSAGSGPTWSNESNIKIVSSESDTQGGAVTPSASNNPSSVTNPPTSPQPVKNKTVSSGQSKKSNILVYHSATVAAATASANPSPVAEIKSQKRINYFSWAGILMIVSGTLVLAYVYLRNSNLREEVSNLFRKRN